MRPTQHARAILEAVSHLHQAGYGRLRLLCYVKEGLGAWRHRLFVSDRFELVDEQSSDLYSLPGMPVAEGETPEAIASNLLLTFPDLMAAAKAPPGDYADWLHHTLETYPDGVFEMEQAAWATVGSQVIQTPYARESEA